MSSTRNAETDVKVLAAIKAFLEWKIPQYEERLQHDYPEGYGGAPALDPGTPGDMFALVGQIDAWRTIQNFIDKDITEWPIRQNT